MLIQCHSCNTKYRLNLERIPKRKTFVRCKNCGTPIYIDPTEEEETVSGVIPPPPAPASATAPAAAPPVPDSTVASVASVTAGESVVECPSCQSRYKLPVESLQRPGIKMKCTQCGHVFSPPEHGLPDAPSPGSPVNVQAQPPPAGASAPPEMPLPNDQRMDTMFDDIRPQGSLADASPEMDDDLPPLPSESELGTLSGNKFDSESPIPDPDQAYLDSVVIQDEEGEEGSASKGPIPETQKSRFFLNPNQYQGGTMADGEQHDDLDLPPLPDEEELQPESASAPPVPPSPPVPVSGEEAAKTDVHGERDVVPGQDPPVLTEKRVLMGLVAASVFILLGAGGWGYWLAMNPGGGERYSIQLGQTHNLSMEDKLEGRYVTNRPSGKRLFVVSGIVENRFPDEDQLGWIRIRGTAYADTEQNKPVGQVSVYAGNFLEDSQLTHWEISAIQAYYGFLNGRKEKNLRIPSGEKVQYQLVFSGIQGPVERTVAEVMSYNRSGKSVFVDTP